MPATATCMICDVPYCLERAERSIWLLPADTHEASPLFYCKEHEISEHPAVQWHYILCRKQGTSHSLAEMFALGQPPGCNTDREFLRGHCNGNQFEGREAEGDHYRRIAEAGGQNTTGKVYLSGLARFPGDPRAWVSGKGDVAKLLDAHGWGADGLVKRPITNVAEPSEPYLDPSLVMEEVDEIIAAKVPEGEGGLVDRLDLAEQVYNRRKPYWVKQSFDPDRMAISDAE